MTAPSESLNVLTLGGSRNIGYLASVRLLEQGATVTFLLRSTAVFDRDETIQKYVKLGSARLVQGDALDIDDVRNAWKEAGAVDAVVFTVGTVPKDFKFCEGFVITPPDLVTHCFTNLLRTMPPPPPRGPGAPQPASGPKIVALSSTGLGPAAAAALPLVLKPLYAGLASPHKDKIGVERVAAHCAGWRWDPAVHGAPVPQVLPPGWEAAEGLPAPGALRRVLIVRPGFLTDGECTADAVAAKGRGKSYRVSEEETRGVSISRRDVAHFIVDALTRRWSEFENKRVNITY